jgi:hypothetical protein
MTDWKEVIAACKTELTTFSFKPTLRTMFYRLFSKGLVPNIKNAYKDLSKHTVRARWRFMEEGDGPLSLPPDCFSDNSRASIANFNEDYLTPQELIDERIDALKNTESDYDQYIHRWHNQPNYVEIWLEKDAMTGTFQSITEGLDVRIVPMKGFASMTFLYETVGRLAYYQQTKKKSLRILYYGDFDPSGDYMDTDLLNRIERMGFDLKANDGEFERVAVTEEQITNYDLPYNPDKVTLDKMKKDTRYDGFIEKYGKLYAVELDALPALIPDIFRQELVIDKVNEYYEQWIYDELYDKYDEDDVRKMLKKSAKELARSL